MDTLSTVILALLTVASPLAISRAKNESWAKSVKVGIPIIVATVLALAYLVLTGSITQGGDVITTILMVYGAQQLAYTTIMRWWATILEQRGQPAAGPAPGADGGGAYNELMPTIKVTGPIIFGGSTAQVVGKGLFEDDPKLVIEGTRDTTITGDMKATGPDHRA